MGNKSIQLPYALKMYVEKALEKKHIYAHNVFTTDDLAAVDELVVDVSKSFQDGNYLDGIELLPNLKRLEIICTNDSTIKQAYQTKPLSINAYDAARISNLKNLTSLKINGQPMLSGINVEQLTNLKSLEISNNNRLEVVRGLDKLQDLTEFVEYGNRQLTNLPGLNELITNNKDNLDDYVLDVFRYPEINHNQRDDCSITYAEAVGRGRIDYRPDEHEIINYWTQKIADKARRFSNDPHEQVIYVERLLAKNIAYDNEALKNDNRQHVNNDGELIGKKNGTNSLYNAIRYKSCVCEGYTRAMQYVLKILGIDTKNVHYLSGENKVQIQDENDRFGVRLAGDSYHSILRVDFNKGVAGVQETFYCDPCWDACHWQKANDHTLPYCLLSYQDMSQDHSLSLEEKNADLVVSRKSYPRDKMAVTMKKVEQYNEYWAQKEQVTTEKIDRLI